MFPRLGRRSYVTVATEIANHQAAQKILGAVCEGILKKALLGSEFLLHPIKEFLVDNGRIKSGNGLLVL